MTYGLMAVMVVWAVLSLTGHRRSTAPRRGRRQRGPAAARAARARVLPARLVAVPLALPAAQVLAGAGPLRRIRAAGRGLVGRDLRPQLAHVLVGVARPHAGGVRHRGADGEGGVPPLGVVGRRVQRALPGPDPQAASTSGPRPVSSSWSAPSSAASRPASSSTRWSRGTGSRATRPGRSPARRARSTTWTPSSRRTSRRRSRSGCGPTRAWPSSAASSVRCRCCSPTFRGSRRSPSRGRRPRSSGCSTGTGRRRCRS